MNLSKPVFLAIALALSCAPATASIVDPLAIDTTAIPLFHGSTGYANGFGLVGDVDYAVYAPGVFNASGFIYTNPSGGALVIPATDYVYTYQGHETGYAALSEIKITLTTTAGNQGIFSGNNGFGPVSGVNPNAATFLISGAFGDAVWGFGGPNPTDNVLTGDSTIGLLFTSPYGPIMLDGTTTDDGTTALVIPVPSPLAPNIPEPGTLTLASFGLMAIALRCLRRRGGTAGL